MSPSRRLLIGAIVLLAAGAGYAIGRALFRPNERVLQPIAFSHQKHVGELELECIQCHEFVESGKHAGLPTLTTCRGCHEEAQTDNPEERKIEELAEAGDDNVFRKLFRIPDHTYYSHQRHVGSGHIPCASCHRSIARTTKPPERPLVRITMEFCIDCHERSNVPSDCTRCHR